ncbi:unnamed protein product [Dovyalis caffra]|uniref:Uncharacterized protein n=1 Tax=Dovyalis caffra TaxID=77055 RepID=A0AAV1QS27_9ROSI|nr:unnamed protein product [Dovyalis caffra]
MHRPPPLVRGLALISSMSSRSSSPVRLSLLVYLLVWVGFGFGFGWAIWALLSLVRLRCSLARRLVGFGSYAFVGLPPFGPRPADSPSPPLYGLLARRLIF